MNTAFSVVLRRGAYENPNSKNEQVVDTWEISASGDLLVQWLRQDQCLVIGDCFPSLSERGDVNEDPIQTVRSVAETHWGRFIFIARNHLTGAVTIYRDPSGMVPCYYSFIGETVAIGTDVRSLDVIGLRQHRIDWDEIANSLIMPNLRRHQTCLKGIFEVAPGEMVVIDGDRSCREQIWNPGNFIGRNRLCTFEEAAELLEATMIQTLKTWCDRYAHPLVSVSGGFDSSAVAVLANKFGSTELLHLYTRSPVGDERRYAAMLAGHLGCEMSIALCQSDAVTVQKNLSSGRPRPSARAFTQVFDEISAGYATKVGASAHFSGGGGDNVFGKLHSAYPLADRYRRNGLGRDLISTALDVCHVTGASMPAVLGQALRGLKPTSTPEAWSVRPDLLTPKVKATINEEPHPWLVRCRNVMPGEWQLVRNIARATALTDHLNIEGDLPTICPLLSQPIVEQCLSFPTWYWVSGGRDRALARAALRAYLPASILDRRGKGAFTGLLAEILHNNWDRIYDDLKEGLLAQHGLLDISAVGEVGAQGADSNRIFTVLYIHETEMWCRNWH
ncbi:asparagine synthase-related protein [Novosphingobium guangzhouense]|uniref:asparagine synthase-related protein n=1 Tax=Novosphingobium guangzhouense TaxID=1850347 RepID=UPI000CCC0FE7|nr:asparagine synthase-related protein [Novosphingobium guangzhouense]